MRLTSVFACLSLLVGVASTLGIPHAAHGDSTTASLSIASRDAPEFSRRSMFDNDELFERSSLNDDELGERSWVDEDQLAERLFNNYDYGLEARRGGSRQRHSQNRKVKGKPAKKPVEPLTGPASIRKGAQPGQKIFWDPQAVKELNRLDLHGKERKAVKKFHVKTAKKAMKENDATAAKIYNIAHKNTSPIDKNMHVTGKLYKGEKGDILIRPSYTPSDPNAKQPMFHHMYTPSNDPNKLPAAMKNAVIRKGKTLDQI